MSPAFQRALDDFEKKYQTIPTGSHERGTSKYRCHFALRGLLRLVALELGLPPAHFNIRPCYGGPGVAGESILHYEKFYVQVHNGWHGEGIRVLYRTCKGLHDYTGGPNNYCSLRQLPGCLKSILATT